MIDAGLWAVSERKLHHRSHRDRRAAYGELVQMDTSIHPWFEDRSTEQPVLIAMIDDATGRLHARFARSDTGRANRELIVSYLERFGRMGSLYVDRASHFRSQTRKRILADKPPMSSLINRALDTLDINLISQLNVLRHLDGTLSFTWRNRRIQLVALQGLPATPQPQKQPQPPSKSNHPNPKDHPWRRDAMRFAVRD